MELPDDNIKCKTQSTNLEPSGSLKQKKIRLKHQALNDRLVNSRFHFHEIMNIYKYMV